MHWVDEVRVWLEETQRSPRWIAELEERRRWTTTRSGEWLREVVGSQLRSRRFPAGQLRARRPGKLPNDHLSLGSIARYARQGAWQRIVVKVQISARVWDCTIAGREVCKSTGSLRPTVAADHGNDFDDQPHSCRYFRNTEPWHSKTTSMW